MTAFYGGGSYKRKENEEKNIEVIGKALEIGNHHHPHHHYLNHNHHHYLHYYHHHENLGINFLDTAWIYQSWGVDGEENYTNESLVGKAVKKYGRDKFVIATKFGIGMGADGMIFSGKEDFIRTQLQESLDRLDIEYIDLYYMHRMDPETPIEETIGALKKLIDEGKIKYIGLSECTPAELERANKIHPITAIQMEWSLQTRDIEDAVVPMARNLGVAIVPYSPLGRGLLANTFASFEDLDEKDWRRQVPRFKDGAFETNTSNAEFFAIAKERNVTPAQLALAWVIAQGEDVVPIPGTKNMERLAENAKAVEIAETLTADDMERIKNSVKQAMEPRYEGMIGTFNTRL